MLRTAAQQAQASSCRQTKHCSQQHHRGLEASLMQTLAAKAFLALVPGQLTGM